MFALPTSFAAPTAITRGDAPRWGICRYRRSDHAAVEGQSGTPPGSRETQIGGSRPFRFAMPQNEPAACDARPRGSSSLSSLTQRIGRSSVPTSARSCDRKITLLVGGWPPTTVERCVGPARPPVWPRFRWHPSRSRTDASRSTRYAVTRSPAALLESLPTVGRSRQRIR